jgi:hypothetical protein
VVTISSGIHNGSIYTTAHGHHSMYVIVFIVLIAPPKVDDGHCGNPQCDNVHSLLNYSSDVALISAVVETSSLYCPCTQIVGHHLVRRCLLSSLPLIEMTSF